MYCQALEAGPPLLGHAGEQYRVMRSAQVRLRETHLAEAGSFWALSNYFIMKEVGQHQTAPTAAMHMCPQKVACAVFSIQAGRWAMDFAADREQGDHLSYELQNVGWSVLSCSKPRCTSWTWSPASLSESIIEWKN